MITRACAGPLQVWAQVWAGRREVKMANSDQPGGLAQLFDLAHEFAAGKLDRASAGPKIRAALVAQDIGISLK